MLSAMCKFLLKEQHVCIKFGFKLGGEKTALEMHEMPKTAFSNDAMGRRERLLSVSKQASNK
jgi:hypothetical protein